MFEFLSFILFSFPSIIVYNLQNEAKRAENPKHGLEDQIWRTAVLKKVEECKIWPLMSFYANFKDSSLILKSKYYSFFIFQVLFKPWFTQILTQLLITRGTWSAVKVNIMNISRAGSQCVQVIRFRWSWTLQDRRPIIQGTGRKWIWRDNCPLQKWSCHGSLFFKAWREPDKERSHWTREGEQVWECIKWSATKPFLNFRTWIRVVSSKILQ